MDSLVGIEGTVDEDMMKGHFLRAVWAGGGLTSCDDMQVCDFGDS